jgi:phage tail protein X
VEMVRQRIAFVSGIAAAPGAGRDQGSQGAPLAIRTLPIMTSGAERSRAGTAVSPGLQEPARALTLPAVLPSSAPPLSTLGQSGGGGAKEFTIKKVVVIRAGDTLSHILAQEYGEYTKAVVDLVSEANPGLRNIHFLEIGQRLILPERPE